MKNSPQKLLATLQQQWLCPISQQPMIHPMIANDGHSYQKFHIEQWLNHGNHQSPITREMLQQENIVSNYVLRNVINKSHQIIPKFQQKLNSSLNLLQRADEFIFNLYVIMTKQLQIYEKIRDFKLVHDQIIHYQQRILQKHKDWQKIQIKYNKWKKQQMQLQRQNLQLIQIFLFIIFVVGVVLGCVCLLDRYFGIENKQPHQFNRLIVSYSKRFINSQLFNLDKPQLYKPNKFDKLLMNFEQIMKPLEFFYRQAVNLNEPNQPLQQQVNKNIEIESILHNPIITQILTISLYPFKSILCILSYIFQLIYLSIYNQLRLVYELIQFISIQIIQLNRIIEQCGMKMFMFGVKRIYDFGYFVVDEIPGFFIDVIVYVLRFISKMYEIIKNYIDRQFEAKQYLIQVIGLIHYYLKC